MSSGTTAFVDRIDPFAKRSLKKKQKKSQGSSRYRNSGDVELQQLPLLKGTLFPRKFAPCSSFWARSICFRSCCQNSRQLRPHGPIKCRAHCSAPKLLPAPLEINFVLALDACLTLTRSCCLFSIVREFSSYTHAALRTDVYSGC